MMYVEWYDGCNLFLVVEAARMLTSHGVIISPLF